MDSLGAIRSATLLPIAMSFHKLLTLLTLFFFLSLLPSRDDIRRFQSGRYAQHALEPVTFAPTVFFQAISKQLEYSTVADISLSSLIDVNRQSLSWLQPFGIS